MAAEMQKTRYSYYKQAGVPIKLPADKPTKASQLAHSFVNEVKPGKENAASNAILFKLSKFQRVAPRTDTHHGKRAQTAQGRRR